MKIPIAKPRLSEKTLEKVKSVLESGMWIDSSNVKKLEDAFARYLGVKYARAVSNGTAALMVAVNSLNIGLGDEVIVPSFSFAATANCVLFQGAKPIFTDIDPMTFNIDPRSVKKNLSNKTKAIIPVHLYGLPAPMDELSDLAHDRIWIIEDACQAHGAEYNGQKVGSIGTIGVFSLYPTKNMVCGGEGGLIVTNNEEIFERIQLFVNHGQDRKYHHVVLGYNFRMSEVNAVIALDSLKTLDSFNDKRIANAESYSRELSDVTYLDLPVTPNGCKHVFHQYTIKSKIRDQIIKTFEETGIGFGIHYPLPIHLQPFYRATHGDIHLKNAETVAKHAISIPVRPDLTGEEKRKIISVLRGLGG
ncbi:MAG: DegT/DnrJ/EryC1/StrS family aminotransferase [Candidatus Heimdallarchaeota archaeon]